ncbi:hypothetical protein CCUS01_12730 [Colletotrichum cuscutae]|uniref:Uncharacterized protein n=1 Tax=Colletotrichum cuscutae TaxID=1209917 RepID=A0AAI9XFC4_9PEZI|nr:hypothetical protein CCUS01_12730 [Colletotrichum cuscutae]
MVIQELAASAHWRDFKPGPFLSLFVNCFILKRNSLSRLSIPSSMITWTGRNTEKKNAWPWTETATTTAVHKARENVHVQPCGLIPKLSIDFSMTGPPYRYKTEMPSRRISYDNHDRLRLAFSLNHVYEFTDGFWASAVSERIVFTLSTLHRMVAPESKEMGHLREHEALPWPRKTDLKAISSRDWYQDRAQAPSTTYMRRMSLAVPQHACASSHLLHMFLEAFVLLINSSKTLTSNVRTQPILSLLASGTLGAAASQRCYRSGQASCNVESSKLQKGVTSCSVTVKPFFSILVRRDIPRATFPEIALHPDSPSGRQQVFANPPPNRVPTPGFWVLSTQWSPWSVERRITATSRSSSLRGGYSLLTRYTTTSERGTGFFETLPCRSQFSPTLVNDSFPVSLEGYKPNGWDSFSSPLDECDQLLFRDLESRTDRSINEQKAKRKVRVNIPVSPRFERIRCPQYYFKGAVRSVRVYYRSLSTVLSDPVYGLTGATLFVSAAEEREREREREYKSVPALARYWHISLRTYAMKAASEALKISMLIWTLAGYKWIYGISGVKPASMIEGLKYGHRLCTAPTAFQTQATCLEPRYSHEVQVKSVDGWSDSLAETSIRAETTAISPGFGGGRYPGPAVLGKLNKLGWLDRPDGNTFNLGLGADSSACGSLMGAELNALMLQHPLFGPGLGCFVRSLNPSSVWSTLILAASAPEGAYVSVTSSSGTLALPSERDVSVQTLMSLAQIWSVQSIHTLIEIVGEGSGALMLKMVDRTALFGSNELKRDVGCTSLSKVGHRPRHHLGRLTSICPTGQLDRLVQEARMERQGTVSVDRSPQRWRRQEGLEGLEGFDCLGTFGEATWALAWAPLLALMACMCCIFEQLDLIYLDAAYCNEWGARWKETKCAAYHDERGDSSWFTRYGLMLIFSSTDTFEIRLSDNDFKLETRITGILSGGHFFPPLLSPLSFGVCRVARVRNDGGCFVADDVGIIVAGVSLRRKPARMRSLPSGLGVQDGAMYDTGYDPAPEMASSIVVLLTIRDDSRFLLVLSARADEMRCLRMAYELTTKADEDIKEADGRRGARGYEDVCKRRWTLGVYIPYSMNVSPWNCGIGCKSRGWVGHSRDERGRGLMCFSFSDRIRGPLAVTIDSGCRIAFVASISVAMEHDPLLPCVAWLSSSRSSRSCSSSPIALSPCFRVSASFELHPLRTLSLLVQGLPRRGREASHVDEGERDAVVYAAGSKTNMMHKDASQDEKIPYGVPYLRSRVNDSDTYRGKVQRVIG